MPFLRKNLIVFFWFRQFPTCSQDVSRHPEGGQSADHGSSPQAGHELGEIGENDRYGAPDPAEGRKSLLLEWPYFPSDVSVEPERVFKNSRRASHPMPLMNLSSRKTQKVGAKLARLPNTPLMVRETTKMLRRPLLSARYPHM